MCTGARDSIIVNPSGQVNPSPIEEILVFPICNPCFLTLSIGFNER